MLHRHVHNGRPPDFISGPINVVFDKVPRLFVWKKPLASNPASLQRFVDPCFVNLTSAREESNQLDLARITALKLVNP